jgi:hypothetical protein
MPWPRVVAIVEKEDGIFLERLLTDGTVVGDTSHTDMEEAREQAQWEYGTLLGRWLDVPSDVPDDGLAAFAIANL